jgi:hypothetical protein
MNPKSNDNDVLATVKASLLFEIGLEDPELGLVRVVPKFEEKIEVRNHAIILNLRQVIGSSGGKELLQVTTAAGLRPKPLRSRW